MGLRFRKSRCYTIIDLIKGRTVMYIAKGNDCLQHKAVLAAGRVRLVGKLPLALSLDKQAAVRAGHAPSYSMQFLLLPPGQLLLQGIVLPLLCWSTRLVVIIKCFLPMDLPVLVHLSHQFLGILFRGCRDLDLHLLFRVGIGLDMRTVYKDRLGGKIARLSYFLQDPTEYLVYRLFRKTAPEITTHGGKMWCFLLQAVPQKSAIRIVEGDLLRRLPKGR